jgi:hypothetical protein
VVNAPNAKPPGGVLPEPEFTQVHAACPALQRMLKLQLWCCVAKAIEA